MTTNAEDKLCLFLLYYFVLHNDEVSSSGCDEYDFEPSVAYSQDDATFLGTELEGMYDCSTSVR